MKLSILFFSIFITSHVSEASQSDYPLPASKINLLLCYTKVSALHAGLLEKQWLFNHNTHFFVQYEIQDENNKAWLTLCDLDNGEILKDDTTNGRKQ